MPKPEISSVTLFCKRHPQTETRLSCRQCEVPVCPKCMIPCEVGFKCPDCVKQTQSHLVKVTWLQYGLGSVASFGSGVLYGFSQNWIGGFGYIGILLAYAIGNGLGRLSHKLSGYKFNPLLTTVTTVSLILGLLMGPFGLDILGAIALFSGNTSIDPTKAGAGMMLDSSIMIYLLSALKCYLFYKGFRQPFDGVWL